MPHTDAQILSRKIGLGPIGSAKINKLTEAADNQSSDLPETTRVLPSDRVLVGSPVDPTAPAPAASLTPRHAGVGAFINTPVHGERCGN